MAIQLFSSIILGLKIQVPKRIPPSPPTAVEVVRDLGSLASLATDE